VKDTGRSGLRGLRRTWISLGRFRQLVGVLLRHGPGAARSFQGIVRYSRKPSDISDHLPDLFLLALRRRPTLLVELGVRGGESAGALTEAARILSANIVGVDIEDCGQAYKGQGTHFVHSDDIAFSEKFPEWCAEHGLPPSVDLLFIDTSHLYDHTREEIRTWFEHLSPACTVLFHDTNLQRRYCRRDGSQGYGWDNERGVARALQEYLELEFDENAPFRGRARGWEVRHRPWCNGLTWLDREAQEA